MTGTLYVVATPLGNLEDLSVRATRVLCEVGLVACEDTRRTGLLLRHVGSKAKLLSTFAHNEARRAEQLVERLREGQDVALVSDAGTPCISDPGERVLRACLDAGIKVTPIPGPSAPITLLSAAGVATQAFHFVGFAPRTDGARKTFLTRTLALDGSIVFYESARRVVALLEAIVEVGCGERLTCVGRELTKLHEEFVRGPAREVLREFAGREQIKGELTIAVEGATQTEEVLDVEPEIVRMVEAMAVEGVSARSMRNIVAATFELQRKDAYTRVLAVLETVQGEG